MKSIDKEIRYNNMFTMLTKINDVRGDVIELGVAKGEGTLIMADILKNQEKMVYGFDTFSGYTQEDIQAAKFQIPGLLRNQASGRWNNDPNILRKKIKDKGLSNSCKIIEGDIKQTVPDFVVNNPDIQISMVYIDCNAYLPAIIALKALKNNLSDGSFIVVDEHSIGGETRAFMEFMPNEDFHQVAHTGKHGPRIYGVWRHEKK